MTSPLNDPTLESLLARLYSKSKKQNVEIKAYIARRAREGTIDQDYRFDEDMHRFFADKLVALDQ